MSLKPLFDRVVIKDAEMEETTKSGLILASTAKEKPQYAHVVAVGPGGVVDGKEIVMQVEVGQKVVYSIEFQGGRQGVFQRTSDQYPADGILLCGTVTRMASPSDWRYSLVW